MTTSAITEFRQVKFYLPGSEARKRKASSPLSLTKEDCRDIETTSAVQWRKAGK